MSEKLYYNLTSLVIPSFAEACHQKKIQIHCDCLDCSILKADGVNERERVVGTGCSLGVDSFSTILKYLSDSIPPNYRITHLTYFNVGALGNNTEKAIESWEKDYPLIKEYADFKKLPLVTVSSNIGILYEGWNFDLCHHSRNLGAVMALQKLFIHYVYASGFPILDLSLDSETTAYYETVIGPGLSTENTEISIGLVDYTRIDKTRLICDHPETYSRFFVCWREILKNNYNDNRSDVQVLNCGRCEKCRRTMLTIYLLGKEEQYKRIFDWEYFHKHFHFSLGFALANKKRKSFYEEIVELMRQTGYRLSLYDRIWQIGLTLYYSFKDLLSNRVKRH